MNLYRGTLNNVRLIGYLRDVPDVIETASGHVATAYVMTQGPHKDDQGDFSNNFTEWHRVIARDSQALLLAKYGRPNMQFYIEGKLHTRRDDSVSAEERGVTEIIADKLERLEDGWKV